MLAATNVAVLTFTLFMIKRFMLVYASEIDPFNQYLAQCLADNEGFRIFGLH